MDEQELRKFAEWIESLQLYAAKLGFPDLPLTADEVMDCYLNGDNKEQAFSEMMRPD